MAIIPAQHINDAQVLSGADAKITLYEMTPSIGSGTLRFKDDSPVTWRGQSYFGIPLTLEGDEYSSEGTSPQPSLTIGQTNIDLSVFKPLIWTGGLDNARIVRYKVLLTNLLGNLDIKETSVFRVKRIDAYSTSVVKLSLSLFTPSGPSTLPFRQYVPPDFPFVVF